MEPGKHRMHPRKGLGAVPCPENGTGRVIIYIYIYTYVYGIIGHETAIPSIQMAHIYYIYIYCKGYTRNPWCFVLFQFDSFGSLAVAAPDLIVFQRF